MSLRSHLSLPECFENPMTYYYSSHEMEAHYSPNPPVHRAVLSHRNAVPRSNISLSPTLVNKGPKVAILMTIFLFCQIQLGDSSVSCADHKEKQTQALETQALAFNVMLGIRTTSSNPASSVLSGVNLWHQPGRNTVCEGMGTGCCRPRFCRLLMCCLGSVS